ncbi:MAG: hypothetical protein K1X85_09700 [Ignavibacteria bacterium]|nr:hypothetical protein [Ignavibacteria bacterium]
MKLLLTALLPLTLLMSETKLPFQADEMNTNNVSYGSALASGISMLQELMVFPSNVPQVEIPLAAHPVNKDVFAAASITGYYPGGYTTGFYRTTNGGASWTGTDAIRNLSGEIIVTTGDPQIVITPDDRHIVSYLKMNGSVFKLGVSYSTNSGANWSSTYFVPGVDTADKVVMAVDNYSQSPYYGRCYMAYSERSGIFFSYSSNSGTTWSTVKKICPSNRNSRTGASIATGPAGEVYVSWPYFSNQTDYIGFASSTDGGINWDSTDFAITTKASAPSFRMNLNLCKLNGLPVIAVDKSGGPNHGRIYASFIEKKASGSPALDTCDIVMMSSTNKGVTWSSKKRVNESSASSKSYQLFHQLCIDKQGGINFIYVDTRDTPTNDSFMVYMSRSTDGGNSFADERASSHKFKYKQLPSDQRLFGVPSYIGSYIGLAASADRVLGIWFDNVDEQYRAYSVTMPLSTALSVKLIPQGTYLSSMNRLRNRDSVTLYLRSSVYPYQIIDSARCPLDSTSFTAATEFTGLQSGNYFIVADHKKSISVWSSAPVAVSAGSANSYDFTAGMSSAFGDNQILVDSDPPRYACYSGDVSNDEVIDVSDVSQIENDAFEYVTGNVITDINGDGFVDVTDIAFADYGASNFVMCVTP